MRKMYQVLVAVTGLLFATLSFAANDISTQHYTSKIVSQAVTNPLSAMTTTAQTMAKVTMKDSMPKSIMPTDITIVNGSSAFVYVVVPGTSIYDALYPEANDHIIGSDYFMTRVVLRDPAGATFYDAYVCNRALITVFGGPGYYRIYHDPEYCT